jgi:hypothetical protein
MIALSHPLHCSPSKEGRQAIEGVEDACPYLWPSTGQSSSLLTLERAPHTHAPLAITGALVIGCSNARTTLFANPTFARDPITVLILTFLVVTVFHLHRRPRRHRGPDADGDSDADCEERHCTPHTPHCKPPIVLGPCLYTEKCISPAVYARHRMTLQALHCEPAPRRASCGATLVGATEGRHVSASRWQC